MLVTAYIDDSGTAPDQVVAAATALVLPTDSIPALESEWDALKKKEGFSDFHMSVFAARNHKFGFDWNDDKHERVYQRVRELTIKYGLGCASFTVFKKDYDEVVPAELRQPSGNYHYSWAVRHLVDFLHGWRLKNNVSNPLDYIFDSMKKNDERRKEIEAVMDQQGEATASLGFSGEFKSFDFRNRKEFAGLQCVDMMGWISYQYALFVFCGRKPSSDAQIGWEHFEKQSGFRLAVALKRSELERWVSDPQAVEHTKKWFLGWEAKKTAGNTRR